MHELTSGMIFRGKPYIVQFTVHETNSHHGRVYHVKDIEIKDAPTDNRFSQSLLLAGAANGSVALHRGDFVSFVNNYFSSPKKI